MDSINRHIDTTELLEMEQRYRANFINSLTGFKSVALVGTSDKSGQKNLAIFNSIVHLGAHPPLIGMVTRPDSVDRHTLQNILETGYYTINHVQEEMMEKAHQTSARYPKTISEFDAVGLEDEVINDFPAPFVKASTIKIGVQFKEKVPFTINGTIFVIGEIKQITLPKDVVQADGFVDLVKAGTITNSGLDSYHVVLDSKRFPYAKP
jgi:flavin reductase (DIM6/NTAB) family NADH-FMN oxidoreductase RutF